MQRKKLPIGIQTFRDIRETKNNFVYIDKTRDAFKMANGAKYYFLSRPRRFGKSLFLDTLSEIFKGNKYLFEGLYIYDKWDWEDQYPVIKVSFGSGSYTSTVLINSIFERIFNYNNDVLDLEVKYNTPETSDTSLYELITSCYRKYGKKVVLLIDEYDKLIIDNITNDDKAFAMEARAILRNFYSVLKDCDEYLRFVFITGVTKFSKLNLFSGLNNLEDITIDTNYATITGYTQGDLEREFAEYLDGVDMEKVKTWYNGYNYLGDPIYNPFGILLFFSKNCEYDNYWWETGNPSFLIEKLKEGNYFLPDLQNIAVSKEILNAFDIEHIDLVALLWQTGYLTFNKKINNAGLTLYQLKVPNLEVQSSLNVLFFNYLSNLRHERVRFHLAVYEALNIRNPEKLKEQLIALFAAIPYNNYVNNTISDFEGYYASVLFAFFSALGIPVVAEDTTNKGRIDMTVLLDDVCYIIEFKVGIPKEPALHQAETRRYYEKYQGQGKDIYLVGIHFSSEERNITGFEWKAV